MSRPLCSTSSTSTSRLPPRRLLNEALEQRFQALREPELRRIAQKKLEGYTNQEIAQELKCTVPHCRGGKLERIRTYWGKTDD